MGDARFASDNAAGVHPAVMQALADANTGAALAYGHDAWTARATDAIREAVGWPNAAVLFAWGGTGTNILAMRVLASRVEAVVCADSAHVVHAETGAPQVVGGVQLLQAATVDGRVTPKSLLAAIPPRDGDHRTRPSALSVANATERGTVYSPEQMEELASAAHDLDLAVHVDGARLMHAAAALDVDLADLLEHVDVVSLGGTKNGMLGAEALVVRDPRRARDAGRHRKQITQLPSKMRFVACQFEAMLTEHRWRAAAQQALHQAQRLAEGLAAIPGITLASPVQTNAVFVRAAPHLIAAAQARYDFEVWDAATGLVRWMTAFDTTDADVDAFVATIREAA